MTTFAIYRNAIRNLADKYETMHIAAENRQLAQQIDGSYHPDTLRDVALETDAVNTASLVLRVYIDVFGAPTAMRIGKCAERYNTGKRHHA